MNQISTVNTYTEQAYLYADSSLNLGDLSKQPNDAVLVNVDYRQLGTIGITSFNFQVDIGSNPPLMVTSAILNSTANILTFIISQGLPGTTYQLSIVVNYNVGLTRTDVLTIDVPVDAQCTLQCTPVGTIINQAPVFGQDNAIYVNSSPKYNIGPVQPSGASVMDQWYNTTLQTLNEYVTNGINFWWQQVDTAVPPPSPPAPLVIISNIYKLRPIIPDGVSNSFFVYKASGSAPNINSSSDLQVSVDGVMQEPGIDFAVANANQVTFTVAPLITTKIFMVWIDVATINVSIAPATVGTYKLQAIIPNGTTTSFSVLKADNSAPSFVTSAELQVSVDGVIQEPDIDYTASSNTVVFSVAPLANAKIYMVWTSYQHT